jgi:hypothetical protein
MASPGSTLLARGLAVLFTQHGEACTCTSAPTGFTGLRRIETRDLPQGGGTYEETTLLCYRSSFSALPDIGDPVVVGGVTYRLAGIRLGEQPGTLRLHLEEEIR